MQVLVFYNEGAEDDVSKSMRDSTGFLVEAGEIRWNSFPSNLVRFLEAKTQMINTA